MELRLIMNGGGDVRVSNELRGWRLEGGDAYVRPSEISTPCPTKRDVWLLRSGVRLPSDGVVGKGVAYHNEILSILGEVVLTGWDGLRRAVDSVRTHAGVWALSIATAWLANGGIPPMAIEPKLPPALGFTSSRPDLVVGNSPAEIAYVGDLRSRYVELKKVELAAYALIMEALTHIPINNAYLIEVSDRTVRVEVVGVDDTLRTEALSMRDSIAAMIKSKNPPPIPHECPQTCPLRRYCLGGGDG